MYGKSHILIALCVLSLVLLNCTVKSTIESAREARKEKSRSYLNLGYSYLRDGDSTSALREFLKAEEITPNKPDIHNALGLAYSEKEKYEKAIFHFEKASKLDPRYSDAYNNLGTVYLKQGRWDLAIQNFQKAVSDLLYQTPEHAYFNIGLVYYKKGQIQEAIYNYKKAIEVAPYFANAHCGLGLIYADLGRWKDAIDEYELAIKYFPNHIDALYHLGLAYLELGSYEKAKEAFEKVIEIAPESEGGHLAREQLEKGFLKQIKSEQIMTDTPIPEEAITEEVYSLTLKEADAITDIESHTEGDILKIILTSNGVITRYEAFLLDDPTRLVIDVFKITKIFSQRLIKINNPYIDHIRIGTHPDRLRLCLDSSRKEFPPYQILRNDNRLVILMGKVQKPESKKMPMQSSGR